MCVCVYVGLSVEFARALFHVWLQEKDVQNVSATLKRSGLESKLMVLTLLLHFYHQPQNGKGRGWPVVRYGDCTAHYAA